MWGRVSLAGLLLAGCIFDPRGSSSGSETDAGSGGAADAARSSDGAAGAIDAAILPDATPIEPVLLETLTIEAQNTDPVQSTVVLVVGQRYRLVASGVVAVRTDGWSADADYYWDDDSPNVAGDSAAGVDYGLAVNDTGGSSSRSPDWGEYTLTHVYKAVITGDDDVVSAVFYDFDNSNNSGSMTLEIWGPPP